MVWDHGAKGLVERYLLRSFGEEISCAHLCNKYMEKVSFGFYTIRYFQCYTNENGNSENIYQTAFTITDSQCGRAGKALGFSIILLLF